LVVWIDDVLISVQNQETADWMKRTVEARWAPKGKSIKFEVASLFLGANIVQNEKFVKLTQESYINAWIKDLRAAGKIQGKMPKPTTPFPAGYEINRKECPGKPQVRSEFRTMIAKIGWLAIVSRPDLAFVSHSLAKVAHDPSEEHIAMCMRVIAYIASTAGLGVIYHRQTKASAAHHIRASADASHQTDPVTRKSCSGYVCFLNGGALNWSSKSQQIITLSSCESEIVACVDAVKDVILLRRLLEDQRGTKEPPTEVDQDNTSAIRIIENPELVLSGSRTKHIHARFLWIKQNIDAGEIMLHKTGTDNMEADFLTKALALPKFLKFRQLIMSG
jgi:hypothetical protein